MKISRFGRRTAAAAAARRPVAVLLAATTLGVLTVGGAATTSGCRSPRFGNMLSRSQEIDLGHQTRREVERRYRVDNDPEVNARMQRIAARIFPLARRDFDVPYEIKVLKNKEVNAFALPGGPIYFNRGLIDLAASDDEIAAVLGHEATHVSKRHSGRQISDAQTKGTLAQLLLGRAGNLANLAAGIALNLEQLNYSRGDEAQSDEIGFRYLTEAGYEPEAMASFFRKMEKKVGGGGGPEWLRSHPLTRKRIEAADRRAQEYRAGRGENPRPPQPASGVPSADTAIR